MQNFKLQHLATMVVIFSLATDIGRSDETATGRADAHDPVTLQNVISPGPNQPDEPFAAEFSLDAAVRFLDAASLTWQKNRKCFTCHTNFAYLYARPAVSWDVTAHQQVRSFAEDMVDVRWPDSGPRWDAEVVATAAALAFNDSATSGQLHRLTRTALDRMWTIQKEHGGWNWLKCDWPPMESDDHYGVTVAAIAVGAAPENYLSTEAAQQGLLGIRRYLNQNPPPTLHHEAMLLWADSYGTSLITAETRSATIRKLIDLQKADGGWALATLGDWQRGDEKEQDLDTSDGYGTGFVLYVLRKANVPADAEYIQQGIRWLKSNQRASGRWFTRSLFKDNHHFISHAGTSMAVMALQACSEPRISQLTAEPQPTSQPAANRSQPQP